MIKNIKTTNRLKLIGKSESVTIEWKQSLSEIDEIIETAVGFANAEGGRIFVGISPEGKVVGVQIGKGTIEKLVNQIAQNTDPKLHPRIAVKRINLLDVLVVEVKESHDHLALAFGRPYIRVGRSTVKMSKDEYEHLILDKNKDRIRFDSSICEGAALKDINRGFLKEFVLKGKFERGLALSEKLSVHETLMRLKLLKGNKPNNAAILLFGSPHDFYPSVRLNASVSKVWM